MKWLNIVQGYTEWYLRTDICWKLFSFTFKNNFLKMTTSICIIVSNVLLPFIFLPVWNVFFLIFDLFWLKVTPKWENPVYFYATPRISLTTAISPVHLWVLGMSWNMSTSHTRLLCLWHYGTFQVERKWTWGEVITKMWMLPLVRFNFDGTIYQCRGPGSGGAGVGLPKMTYTGRLYPIGEPFLSFSSVTG